MCFVNVFNYVDHCTMLFRDICQCSTVSVQYYSDSRQENTVQCCSHHNLPFYSGLCAVRCCTILFNTGELDNALCHQSFELQWIY